jgi:hypothetical protein
MKPEDFIAKPWSGANLHPHYEQSFLHMRPAPEYASGEVLLASLYRNVGFGSPLVSEGTTPQRGRDLLKQIEKRRGSASSSITELSVDSWEAIVCRSLASPKQPNQASSRFLQICPLVPDAALYSLSARLASNTWNPGALVAKVIEFGTRDHHGSVELWEQVFQRLGIEDDEDVWAKFLQGQFEKWRPQELKGEWQCANEFKKSESVAQWRTACCEIPADRFASDLRHVLALKGSLTRRQWVSMLESLLRIGTASHVLWVCHANSQCLELLSAALQGKEIPARDDFAKSLAGSGTFWRYGQKASHGIQSAARNFVVARAGLNLLLWHCQALQKQGKLELPEHGLGNVDAVLGLANKLREVRSHFPLAEFRAGLQAALEEDPRVVACKRGISSNVTEFLGHVLRQRQTSEPGMDSYDQGFYLRKAGRHSSAPWVVSLGPVAVMTLVHCCVRSGRGPRTVEDLCRHLSSYGIEARPRDVTDGDLGNTLRNLGLVLDSPDAEGGMVLFSPLNKADRPN